jgi:signal transduction histidine kinase
LWPGDRSLPARALSAAILLLAIALLLMVPGFDGLLLPIYGPLVVAMIVGALLTVRLRPQSFAASSMVVIPTVTAYVRLGGSALPAFALALMAAGLIKRAPWARVLLATACDVVAFGAAHGFAQTVAGDSLLVAIAFAISFPCLRVALRWLAQRTGVLEVAADRTDEPNLWLSLALVPLAVLPIVAWLRLGDGALLLSLAALLVVLFVAREAANLAVTRAEVEAERDRLATANTLQDELIHLITHDVRSPLTAILGYAQLGRNALGRHNVERVPEYLDKIEQGSRTVERLIDNLLRLSQIERTGELPPPEAVALSEVAAEVADTLRPLAESKPLELRVDLPAVPLWTYAPPVLLREALSNLVSNAIKYTPAGGAVTLWMRAGDDPAVVLLGVTDTGIGMSDQDLGRLFNRFFRSHDPRAREQQGTGLGLSLTRSVTERIGGKILVTSALDEGTTFTLVLPAHQP